MACLVQFTTADQIARVKINHIYIFLRLLLLYITHFSNTCMIPSECTVFPSVYAL